MNKKMGIRHKFIYSLFSIDSYAEFLKQGLFKSILYITTLTLVLSTLSSLKNIYVFNDDITRLERVFEKNSPDFKLKDGTFSIDSKSPIHYTYSGNSDVLKILINDFVINEHLIIDTSGSTDSSILDKYSNATYIDSKSIVFKKTNNAIEKYYFSNLNILYLDKNVIKNNFELIKSIFNITFLFITPILSIIMNLISVFLILGPITFILNKNLKYNLRYKQCCIITIYSISLPLLLESLINISGFYIEDFMIIFFVISIIYSYLAMSKLNKQIITE